MGCSTVQPVGRGMAWVPLSSRMADWEGRRLLWGSECRAVVEGCLSGVLASRSASESSGKTEMQYGKKA